MKVILPNKYLNELENSPATTFKGSVDHVRVLRLSFQSSAHSYLSQDTMADYTYIGGISEAGVDAIKTGLNPNLCIFLPNPDERRH